MSDGSLWYAYINNSYNHNTVYIFIFSVTGFHRCPGFCVQALLILFWRICRLQKGPEDVPASTALFVLLLLLSLFLDFVSTRLGLPDVRAFEILLIVIIANASILVLTAVLLQLLGYLQRVLQTLSALLGASIFITVLATPVLFGLQTRMDDPGGWGTMLLLLELWHLVITAHILRRALSVSLLLGLMLATGYKLLGYQIVGLFVTTAS